MSQYEVLEVLKKAKRYMDTNEIHEALGSSIAMVRNNCYKLYMHNEVQRKRAKKIIGKAYMYKICD